MAAVLPACDIYIVVGEPSGDAYAASVVEALQARHPQLHIAAAGCSALRTTGIEIDVDMSDYAVMGFVAVAQRLMEFRRLGRRLAEVIRQRRPKVLITVDYPGFNLRLLAALGDLRQSGTAFCHIVAPQVWAWKPRRAKKVARLVDCLCCFFPFEPPLFRRHGGEALFVGHPLVDAVPLADERRRVGLAESLGVDPQAQVLLLAPGSREQEVSTLLPIFDEAYALIAHRLRGRRPIVPIIAKAPHLDHALYRRYSHYRLVEGSYRDLLQIAHVGLIASGTATLEAALCALPHIIAYRGDSLSAAIARQVILTKHVGLPNIIHRERVCPEVLQDECTPVRIAAHLQRLWQGTARQQCRERLLQTRARLGSGGAIGRIADAVEDLWAARSETGQ